MNCTAHVMGGEGLENMTLYIGLFYIRISLNVGLVLVQIVFRILQVDQRFCILCVWSTLSNFSNYLRI